MDYAKLDFAGILGDTDKNGHWLDIEEKKQNEEEEEGEEEKMDTASTNQEKSDNMYMFEGVDYRSTNQKADLDLFDRLIQADDENDRERSSTGLSSSERRLQERPTRRALTEEEKASRAAKIRETKARRKQEMVGVIFIR